MSDKAQRVEILQGIITAAESWELVGRIIATARSREDATRRLQDHLGVAKLGADAILDQQLSSFMPERTDDLRKQLASEEVAG